ERETKYFGSPEFDRLEGEEKSMPLSPADVHNVAFSKPPIGKRGYNEDEVDQFLDLVEDALAQLQDENYELQKQIEDGSGSTKAAAAAPAVDEASVRKSVESELRAEYEKKLADAKSEVNKAKEEASKAKAEANKAKTAKPAAAPVPADNTAEVKAAQDETAKVRQELEAAKKDLEAAKKENSELKSSKASSSAAPAAAATTGATAGAAAGTTGAATPETHMQAARILGLAQDMADRWPDEARPESGCRLCEAREAAERQLAAAASRSSTQLSEADTRSKTMISDAEAKAKQSESEANPRAEAQIRQAEDKAAALEAEATKKHNEVMTTIKTQQTALENRIAELST